MEKLGTMRINKERQGFASIPSRWNNEKQVKAMRNKQKLLKTNCVEKQGKTGKLKKSKETQ